MHALVQVSLVLGHLTHFGRGLLSANALPVTRKVTAEGGAMSGSAVAKEAVPSACEVPPGRPTKTKTPSDVAQKYASQKKNMGGQSQSDVAQKYASEKTEAAARAGETLKLSQEQFLFGLKSV